MEKFYLNGKEVDWNPEDRTAFEDMRSAIPAAAPIPTPPGLFASLGVVIANGVASGVEEAAQLASVYYEPGYLMAAFSLQLDAASYLIFAQTDIPARIEQFKEPGYFELVFSDMVTGDPVEPGRVDIQIIKAR